MSQQHLLVSLIIGLALLGIVGTIFICRKATKAGMAPILRGLYNFPIRPPPPAPGPMGPPPPMGGGGPPVMEAGEAGGSEGGGGDPIGAFHARSNDLGA